MQAYIKMKQQYKDELIMLEKLGYTELMPMLHYAKSQALDSELLQKIHHLLKTQAIGVEEFNGCFKSQTLVEIMVDLWFNTQGMESSQAKGATMLIKLIWKELLLQEHFPMIQLNARYQKFNNDRFLTYPLVVGHPFILPTLLQREKISSALLCGLGNCGETLAFTLSSLGKYEVLSHLLARPEFLPGSLLQVPTYVEENILLIVIKLLSKEVYQKTLMVLLAYPKLPTDLFYRHSSKSDSPLMCFSYQHKVSFVQKIIQHPNCAEQVFGPLGQEVAKALGYALIYKQEDLVAVLLRYRNIQDVIEKSNLIDHVRRNFLQNACMAESEALKKALLANESLFFKFLEKHGHQDDGTLSSIFEYFMNNNGLNKLIRALKEDTYHPVLWGMLLKSEAFHQNVFSGENDFSLFRLVMKFNPKHQETQMLEKIIHGMLMRYPLDLLIRKQALINICLQKQDKDEKRSSISMGRQ